MSVIETYLEAFDFNRGRTLALLDELPEGALGWRPGDGRAHIAWQLMHIGVTEDIFASERLASDKAGVRTEFWDRFRGGSTPDDDIPAADQILDVLAAGRETLRDTLINRFSDERLEDKVFHHPRMQRDLSLRQVLQIINWHEAHHQGQAHITRNLFVAAQG